MTDLVFHKAEKYIEEDLEYYFSGQRDVHNQVKPGDKIYSFTPDSTHLNIDFEDGKVGNFFFPFASGSVERIYIGISFPLYANNWGAAFLRHLMTLVKPGGCVVLPVYPEMQASEKNFWSRSILENIFLSRSRWKGTSNLWAENDGVMSMRFGRKPPPEVDSTANYLLRQSSQTAVRQSIYQQDNVMPMSESLASINGLHWQNMITSTMVEKIIEDHFGRDIAVTISALGADPNNVLLLTELILSPYITIEQGFSRQDQPQLAINNSTDLITYHARNLKEKLIVTSDDQEALAYNALHVITLVNALSDLSDLQQSDLINKAWDKVISGGILIIHESEDRLAPDVIEALLSPLGSVKHYSSIVASEHKPDTEISHYSLMIEQELVEENQHKKGIFWVVHK